MGTHVPAYPIWAKVGWMGVDLFFVLSGFLISNLLFTEYRRHGSIALRRFFLRRAFKIYPSFYFLLAVTLVYCLMRGWPLTWPAVTGEALLTQNYIGNIWGHTWSLAVEEHFYLALPLLLVALVKLKPGAHDPFRAIPWLFAALAVFCLSSRWAGFQALPAFDHKQHYELSHQRFDSLFFGVLLSYLHNFRSGVLMKLTTTFRLPLFVFATLAIAPLMILDYENPLVYTFGFTLCYLSFGSVLLITLYKDKPGIRPGRVEQWIGGMGVYSYSLYLWHVPLAMVFAAINRRTGGSINAYALHAIYFATSLAVGIGLAKLIEMPILKLREKLLPARSGAVEVLAPEPQIRVNQSLVIAPAERP